MVRDGLRQLAIDPIPLFDAASALVDEADEPAREALVTLPREPRRAPGRRSAAPRRRTGAEDGHNHGVTEEPRPRARGGAALRARLAKDRLPLVFAVMVALFYGVGHGRARPPAARHRRRPRSVGSSPTS